MEQADIVYVYDHCYYMLWLAQVASPLDCPPCNPETITVVLTYRCSLAWSICQEGLHIDSGTFEALCLRASPIVCQC